MHAHGDDAAASGHAHAGTLRAAAAASSTPGGCVASIGSSSRPGICFMLGSSVAVAVAASWIAYVSEYSLLAYYESVPPAWPDRARVVARAHQTVAAARTRRLRDRVAAETKCARKVRPASSGRSVIGPVISETFTETVRARLQAVRWRRALTD